MVINLSKAAEISGWMNSLEMEWLAEQAQYGEVVEIGSWQGRSTRAMADNKVDGRIYAVDTWQGSGETLDLLKDKPENWLFDQFRENLADHIMSGIVIPMPMRSTVAADYALRAGIKFKFVFIDATHEYESLKEDIFAWRPLVEKGGILAGHDYDWGYPGVVHAVREFISPTPLQAAGGSSIWYCHI